MKNKTAVIFCLLQAILICLLLCGCNETKAVTPEEPVQNEPIKELIAHVNPEGSEDRSAVNLDAVGSPNTESPLFDDDDEDDYDYDLDWIYDYIDDDYIVENYYDNWASDYEYEAEFLIRAVLDEAYRHGYINRAGYDWIFDSIMNNLGNTEIVDPVKFNDYGLMRFSNKDKPVSGNGIEWFRTPESKQFSQIGFVGETNTIIITFRDTGKSYKYDLSEDDAYGLLFADDPDTYYIENIKDNYKREPVK